MSSKSALQPSGRPVRTALLLCALAGSSSHLLGQERPGVTPDAVSAWVLDTGDGLILFDALYSTEDFKKIVEPGLKRFRLEPASIKYLVLTHAHSDRYCGARYLKESYGTRILASDEDWAEMERRAKGGLESLPLEWAKMVPDHDRDIRDGDSLKLGNVSLSFYLTPGHTPGTVSTVFKVCDGKAVHTVGFFGGLGTPQSLEDKLSLIASAERFKGIVRKSGIDVLIANHPTQDQSIPKLEELRLRRPGDPNPYVIGSERYIRYLSVQQECTRMAMAQQGQR